MRQISLFIQCATVALVAFTAHFAVAQSKPTDPAGTWRWSYEADGKTREDSVTFLVEKGAVSGFFKGQADAPIAIKDAKWKDNQISFTAEYKFKDQSVALAFAGKVKKDDLDGTVTVTTDDGTQEYPWTPKRSVQIDDVLGVWDIVIDADGNQLKPSISITRMGESLNGKYTASEQVIVEATKLKIRDNQLEFHIEGTFDGRKIIADFSGRPYGNNMNGKIDFDLDGSMGEIEFTATRQPPKKK